MTHQFHRTFHGKPVGVYVGHRHKDRHHQTAIVEVFIFFHFFNHHNATIGRSHHHIVGVAWEDAHGTTEEIDYDAVDNDENGQNCVEGYGTARIK